MQSVCKSSRALFSAEKAAVRDNRRDDVHAEDELEDPQPLGVVLREDALLLRAAHRGDAEQAAERDRQNIEQEEHHVDGEIYGQ